MEQKKLVLPGQQISIAEEAEAGRNAYNESDIIYAATAGEAVTSEGKANVNTGRASLELPYIGMDVYCVITKSSPNKAIAGCIPLKEVNGQGRGLEIEAVLPVTEVRRGYVPDMRDEVKIGDIIKAKVRNIEKTGVEISMFGHECGVIAAFCPKCRQKMGLTDIFICGHCGWKERRKLPLAEGQAPPHEEFRRDGPPREGGFRDRPGGFRGRGGGGFRPRGGRPGYGAPRRGPPRS